MEYEEKEIQNGFVRLPILYCPECKEKLYVSGIESDFARCSNCCTSFQVSEMEDRFNDREARVNIMANDCIGSGDLLVRAFDYNKQALSRFHFEFTRDGNMKDFMLTNKEAKELALFILQNLEVMR